jgi:MoxR-like ATPase
MLFTEKFATLQGEVRESLKTALAALKANATYKKSPDVETFMKYKMVQFVCWSMASGKRLYMVGEAGIGKTSFVKWFVENVMKYDFIYIPAAHFSQENLFVPFPAWKEMNDNDRRRVLQTLFFKKFTSDRPKVVFIDEIGRAEAGFANILMELLSEGTLAGWAPKDLVTVIAADNPQGSSYGRLSGLDFAQASRFATIELGAKDTPWRYFLAQQEDLTDVDLTKVFSLFDSLDDKCKEVFHPRQLGHTLPALLDGMPGLWTLPVVNGARVSIVDATGRDRSKDILDRTAAALGRDNRETLPDKLSRTLEYADRKKVNIRFIAGPGIGKSSVIKAELRKSGKKFGYDSVPLMSPEDFGAPFPSEDGTHLELLPMAKFAESEPWVWVLDELCRGSRRTQNALMEPIQEKTLNGDPTSLERVIAIDNPREVAGMKLDVGKNDLAQASRFALTVELDASDIPFGSYLKDVYGEEVATPFVEWWEDDLDDVGRTLCPARSLEIMITLNEAGLDLQSALAFVGGEHVKVPLVELYARLENRPLARLKQVVQRVDEYESLLAAGKDENPMDHATVFLAFHKAEVSQLDAVRDVAKRLYKVLDRQHRIDLIRQGGERQKFWNSILQEEK